MAVAVWDYKGQYKTGESEEVFDTLLAEYLLVDGMHIPKFDETLAKYKVKTVEELAVKQRALLADKPKLLEILSAIEVPLIPVLCAMEDNGITVDKNQLLQFKKELEETIAKTKTELQKEFGSTINLSSPTQIGTFLAEKSGVPLSKTKTGKYATNENELLKHKAAFPVIENLLTYREITKLHSTYTDGLLDKMDAEDKIHTTYNLVGISTGRLSSTNPNLQNIPVASELGRHIKSCFTASADWSLVSFDYSQQELRILAHLSEEDALIKAFASSEDVHRTTASKLFDVPYENVSNEQRYIAKTINFGIIYGMSSYGMSEALQIPREHADAFIKNFYQTFPKIKTYYDTYLQNAKKDGYVETLLGRRRFVFNYPGQKFIDNATKRVLMNYPIQGTAAELMKMAMIDVYNTIVKDKSDIRLLLQIHDELVFEVHGDSKDSQEVIEAIKEHMIAIYPLRVPMEVGVKTGFRWGDVK